MLRRVFLALFLLATNFSIAFSAISPGYKPSETQPPETVNDIFYTFAWGNMKGFIPALIAIAFVVFLVGVVKFIGAGDNEEKRQSGRAMMIYGTIVLFVMIAFWGFVEIIYNSFFTKEFKIPNYLPMNKS